METLEKTATIQHRSLTLDFLAWVARTPRSYTETMEAWRSSCPRLTIWEDALADDFVRVERGEQGHSVVVLTECGIDALEVESR